METALIQINDVRAYKLLESLKDLNIIKILNKEQLIDGLSEKYIGKLATDILEEQRVFQNSEELVNRNIKEAARKKSLGELGELFALKALVDNKFDCIRNLNDNLMNETFADIECEKDGLRYIFSVKARNKYQKNGTLNTRYNLGENVYEKALSAEKKYNASACWMAIQFDRSSFSIYYGSLKDLNGSKAIPVDKCEKGLLGHIWELNKKHYFDFEYYTNQENSL